MVNFLYLISLLSCRNNVKKYLFTKNVYLYLTPSRTAKMAKTSSKKKSDPRGKSNVKDKSTRPSRNIASKLLKINNNNKSTVRKKIVPVSAVVKKNGKREEKKVCADIISQAIDAVNEGQTIREAAVKFGVPKSTLYDKLKNYSSIYCTKGPPTVLTQEEESRIVQWIFYCAEHGFPVTKTRLLDCVQTFLLEMKRKNPFKESRPGKHWYAAFMKRHSDLSLRIAQNLTSTRASVTEEDLRHWFASVKTYLEKKNLLHLEPRNIFNLDETAFMLVPKDNSVITKKGSRSVYQIVGSNEKANLTVLFTAAASGELAAPMILYDLKTTPKKNILSHIPKGWGVGNSERGWMTSETFFNYVTNVFFKWLKDNNYTFPILLYLDGHSSHFTLPLCKFCQENEIELVGLYPNATHILQPLDVAFFHPLKDRYKDTLKRWRIENNVLDFKKFMFAEVLKLVLEKNDFSSSIVHGFKSCGLYPFNPDAVDYNILNKRKNSKSLAAPKIEKSLPDSTKCDNQKLLELFESNAIPSDVLQDFKRNELAEIWDGELSFKGLFESWIKLRKLCGKNVQKNVDVSNIHSTQKDDTSATGEIYDSSPMNQIIGETQSTSLGEVEVYNEFGQRQLISVVAADNSNVSNSFQAELIQSTIEKSTQSTEDQVTPLEVDENPSRIQELNTHFEISPSIVDDTICLTVDGNTDLIQYDISGCTADGDIPLTANRDIPLTVEESTHSKVNLPISSTVANSPNENFVPVDTDPQEACICIETSSVHETEVLGLSEKSQQSRMYLSDTSNDTSVHSSAGASIDIRGNAVSNSPTNLNANSGKLNPTDTFVENSKECVSVSFKNIFSLPNFTVRKKKKTRAQEVPSVAVVDDLLAVLQKKEDDKKLKEIQTLQKKEERKKIKLIKEKEQEVNKLFQQNKKKLREEKRVISAQLKELKKDIKNNKDKENVTPMLEKVNELSAKVEEIESKLLAEEMQVLSKKMKIKQEKM